MNAARGSVRGARPTLVLDEDVEAPPSAELRSLSPLVAALPERQRLTVFLRYYADLDYRSIAEVLGVTVGTVSAALAAAHAALRTPLEGAPP